MMRHRLAIVPRLLALLGTSYFLIATSAPVDPGPPSTATWTSTSTTLQSCWHTAESVSFHVTGTCGPEGDIVVSSPANECAIMALGAAALGLPSAGRFDSSSGGLVSSAWHLSGYLAEGAAGAAGQGDVPIFTVVQDAGADAGVPRADAGPFAVVTDAGTVAHGKAVLRTCTYQAGVTGSPSLACSDDGRAVCTALLTRLP
jgi:hypothetical protein